MKNFSFGVFADVQYGQREPAIRRYYRKAMEKVRGYLARFEAEQVNFMVHMGDLIDMPHDEAGGERCLGDMMALLNGSGIPCVYLVGNHDSGSVVRPVLERAWGFQNDRFYFSFDVGAFHFIVLDTNYNADGVPYDPDTHQWDECYVNVPQLQWLREDLRSCAAEKVLVLSHALLDDGQGDHMVRNAHEVRAILEDSGKELVVLQGHKHCGDFSRQKGIPYYTLKATVEGEEQTYCWVVSAKGDSMTAEVYDCGVRSEIVLF